MPTLRTTIEENSPLINYLNNNWWIGTSKDDGYTVEYSESGFMKTNIPGAALSFTFNGTGVEIYGAKRTNHGQYVVKVDDTSYPVLDGFAPDLYQQILFSATDLKIGMHEVTMINQGTTYLDVDFITWTTEFGGPTDKLYVSTAQDDDIAFKYSSQTSWNQNPKNLGSFLAGSGHETNSPGSSFSYTFQVCQGISLYGPVGPDGAPYSVQIDDHPPRNLTSTKDFYKSQVLLYHANNLGSGQHRLQVTCLPKTPGQSFAVDYVNVFSVTPPQTNQPGTQGPGVRSGPSIALIVGVTASIVAVIGAIACLLIFLYLHRRRRALSTSQTTDESLRTRPPSMPYSRGRSRLVPIPFISLTPNIPTSPLRAALAEKIQAQPQEPPAAGGPSNLNQNQTLRPISTANTNTNSPASSPTSSRSPLLDSATTPPQTRDDNNALPPDYDQATQLDER